MTDLANWKVICVSLWNNEHFKTLSITRPVLDRFQDSSKTGSGINFIAAFLPSLMPLFCCLFADFFRPAFWRFFEYAVQKTRYFLE